MIIPRNLLIAALALVACTSCATHHFTLATPCQGLDWFEIGRRDGVVGRPAEALNAHIHECAAGVAPDADLYMNGRNAGLVDFCTQQSGFELGRAGTPYMSVCPEHLEKKFLPGYQQGLRVHSQENSRPERI